MVCAALILLLLVLLALLAWLPMLSVEVRRIGLALAGEVAAGVDELARAAAVRRGDCGGDGIPVLTSNPPPGPWRCVSECFFESKGCR